MLSLTEMVSLPQWLSMTSNEKMSLIRINATELEIFVDEFDSLEKNIHIVDRFLEEAHKISMTRDHYSARTIVEFLRHHSTLEQTDSEFKLANALCTPIARVTMLFPPLNGLFNFAKRIK